VYFAKVSVNDSIKNINRAPSKGPSGSQCTDSSSLRDTTHGVRIEFLVSGEFPGDGKPKPVSFPDPVAARMEADGVQYITLDKLVELKLASGMTNLGRLKDLADVLELIKTLKLLMDFSVQLDPFVREKYIELWEAAQV